MPSIRHKRRLLNRLLPLCRCKCVFRAALYGVTIEREHARSAECTRSLPVAVWEEKDGDGANVRLMRGRRRELWMDRIIWAGSCGSCDSPCSATVRWPPRSRHATSEAFFRQDLRRHGVRGERWRSGWAPSLQCSRQLCCYFLKAALASLVHSGQQGGK